VGRYASVVDDRFGSAADIAAAKAEAGLEELRRRLFDALAKADKRIVVLIDDIDRLDKHETHTLFRLIKACADFPNVCYVLAFDDTAVAKGKDR
jgi:predicted KAP-like P-loop ATPase